MESWDHMVKTPNYYKSDKVFLWNKELAEDWKLHQKDANVINASYPLKLRYADNVVYKNKIYDKTIKKEKNAFMLLLVQLATAYNICPIWSIKY